MRFPFYIICLLISLNLNIHIKSFKIVSPTNYTTIFQDTSKYVIMNSPANIQFAFNKLLAQDNLERNDLEKIENALIHSIDSFNIKGEKRMIKAQEKAGAEGRINRNFYTIDTSLLKFQLLPVIDDKNKRLVWVNAFCGTKDNWRNELVSVLDGGACYFKMLYNLSENKVVYFRVNGDA